MGKDRLLETAEVDKQAKGVECFLQEERQTLDPATEAQPNPTAAKRERVRSAPPMSMVGTFNDRNEHHAMSSFLSLLLSQFPSSEVSESWIVAAFCLFLFFRFFFFGFVLYKLQPNEDCIGSGMRIILGLIFSYQDS